MTRQAENNYRCHSCNTDLICSHCGNSQSMGSSFSLWLRQLREPLDSSNIFNTDMDYVWFHYRQGWLITLEEKTNGSTLRPQQQEVLIIIDEKLTASNRLNHRTIRGERPIEYRGHYTIVFEKTDPDNSQWILINNHVTDKKGLLTLLATGRFLPQDNPIALNQPDGFILASYQSEAETRYMNLVRMLEDMDDHFREELLPCVEANWRTLGHIKHQLDKNVIPVIQPLQGWILGILERITPTNKKARHQQTNGAKTLFEIKDNDD